MKCKKCGYEKGSEYFEVKHPENKEAFLLCAKCYSEKFLELQPYFCNIFLDSKSKIPLRHHYMSANLIKFLMCNRTFISSFIETHHEKRFPFSIEFNFKKLESRLQYIHGKKIKEIKHTYLTKLILLLKEAYKSLELSVRLVLNNYDRSAVSELRFVFEKYIDFSYLLLPSCSSLKESNEIDFSHWVAGCEFKSTMRQRCECLNQNLLYKPYDLYRLLCKASHGSMIFLQTTDLVFSSFEDPFNFFKYLRWFCLYLWVLELIYNVQELFKKELNITNDEFDKLQNGYSKILNKYRECLTEIKEGRFYEVEFTQYKVKYWLNFEGSILNNWKDNFSGKIHTKLINDYLFLFSSVNHKFD